MDIQGKKPARRRRVARPVGDARISGFAANATSAPRQPKSTKPAAHATIKATQSERSDAPTRNKHAKRPKSVVRARISKRAIVWRSLAVVTIVVLLVVGFLSWRAYANLHRVFRGTGAIPALSKKPATLADLKNEGDSRVNILLLGIGGPGHEAPDLTDTIVIMSVDPVNNTATMLSIPRDLWVDMPVNYFGSQQKINAAYSSGKYKYAGKLDSSNSNAQAIEAGFDSIDQVIKTVADVRIDYHVLVNFRAFKQAVDTVGGVTIDVPERLYDPTIAWENHNNSVIAEKGVQQMDGVEALLYARSRKTTSDYARSERQRQILIALKGKALTLGTLSNPAKIDGLMSAFGTNVYSDLSTQGAVRLYDIMKKIGDSNVVSVDLTTEGLKLVETGRVGTASVVLPIAGFGKYAEIQSYTHSKIPDGYLTREKATITVLGPTEAAAVASANTLKSYGYNVAGTDVTTDPIAQTTVVDLSKGKSPYTRHYLEQRFAVKATTKLPVLPSGTTAPTTKFVIMVAK